MILLKKRVRRLAQFVYFLPYHLSICPLWPQPLALRVSLLW